MQVTVGKEGAVTVVKPLGPITAGELESLEARLTELSRHWTQRLVLNLGEVTCVDSAGLELLVRFHRQFEQRGLKLKLCGMNDLVEKVFTLTRLSGRFDICPDTAAAVRSFL
ncbi:MAG: STAS domain-containing protein [Sedimentisphaerales bacterium]|nr:STAS domain-containing protein [Sedimentisphaerales bacterium]